VVAALRMAAYRSKLGLPDRTAAERALHRVEVQLGSKEGSHAKEVLDSLKRCRLERHRFGQARLDISRSRLRGKAYCFNPIKQFHYEQKRSDQMLTEQDSIGCSYHLQYYLMSRTRQRAHSATKRKSAPQVSPRRLALASLPIFVERGVVSREFAPELALKGCASFATARTAGAGRHGLQGFYYTFST